LPVTATYLSRMISMRSRSGQPRETRSSTLRNERWWSSVELARVCKQTPILVTGAFLEHENELGVTLSSNFKFLTHIKLQANNTTTINGQLKRTFRFWTTNTCRTIYCAYLPGICLGLDKNKQDGKKNTLKLRISILSAARKPCQYFYKLFTFVILYFNHSHNSHIVFISILYYVWLYMYNYNLLFFCLLL